VKDAGVSFDYLDELLTGKDPLRESTLRLLRTLTREQWIRKPCSAIYCS
jgi:hypothetical protein